MKRPYARIRTFALASLLLGGCSGTLPAPPAPVATASPGVSLLYAYSPDDKALLATYPATANGNVVPSSILAGPKTTFSGGTNNEFGGGIAVQPDGTLYVLDGTRAKLLTFAPGSKGNAAPSGIAALPPNSGRSFHVPQYAGFALDTQGNFWTTDRSNGNLVRFPLGNAGRLKPSYTLKPEVQENVLVHGVASTVAADGLGNIYCVCQPNDLTLQLYCITEYRVAGVSTPKLVRSYYGLYGNLDTQIPSSVLYVDPRTQIAYVGIWTPNAILEYPSNAPSGPAPKPNIIFGTKTQLTGAPAAIATDAQGSVYVAEGSSILVFAKNAAGNVAPARIIGDAAHLHYLGQPFGQMLAIP